MLILVYQHSHTFLISVMQWDSWHLWKFSTFVFRSIYTFQNVKIPRITKSKIRLLSINTKNNEKHFRRFVFGATYWVFYESSVFCWILMLVLRTLVFYHCSFHNITRPNQKCMDIRVLSDFLKKILKKNYCLKNSTHMISELT